VQAERFVFPANDYSAEMPHKTSVTSFYLAICVDIRFVGAVPQVKIKN
jgi:predicted amidohydrolase